jgi:hypothetical protein
MARDSLNAGRESSQNEKERHCLSSGARRWRNTSRHTPHETIFSLVSRLAADSCCRSRTVGRFSVIFTLVLKSPTGNPVPLIVLGGITGAASVGMQQLR